MKVVFPYFAQPHQVLHSLPIAASMAERYPDVQVHVAAARPPMLDFIRGLLDRHAPHAPLRIDALELPRFSRLPIKKRTMWKNRQYFRVFDAIVTPERTSLFLGRLGLGDAKLIWTRHGAGDRAIGFAEDVRGFDFVLLSGSKVEQRLLRAGLIRPGHYESGVYAKFDWLQEPAGSAPLFGNGRPTVLYNPHFEPTLSSWERHGRAVLDFFAASERYNLIFAPHIRLFDPPTPCKYRAFERYAGLKHVRVDLGSARSVDMSYTSAADLYLGDVSSQVAEFVCRPRPCVFLNSHRVEWRDRADYEFWTLGPVIDDIEELDTKLQEALSRHFEFAAAQAQYVSKTFGACAGGIPSAARGADAIVHFLRRGPSGSV